MKAIVVLAVLLASCTGRQDEVLHFMLLGDFGGQSDSPYTTEAEQLVASSMARTAAEIGSQFTVTLGDNFYDNGVKSVTDTRFNETFENVFTADSLQSRWYMVCGNHDYYGNASAEVAYTSYSKRWYMPNFYYSETVMVPGTSVSVQFLFIDTIILAGLTPLADKYQSFSGPMSQSAAEQEWAWISSTLQTSKADWVFVAGHYPVWSISHHGPTKVLVERLRPLLIKYNVSAYFSGHDHNMQHLQEDGIPVNYFVNGAGCHEDPSEKHKDDVPTGSLKFFHGHGTSHGNTSYKKGGYAAVAVSSTHMNFTYYSHKGNVQYSTSSARIRGV